MWGATPVPTAGNVTASGTDRATPQTSEETVKDPVKGSTDEIDELFGEFGATLDAMSATGIASADGSARIGNTSVEPAGVPKTSISDDFDPFKEADAFLKELDNA